MSARLVGYLFTDIEGSTQRWEKVPSRMRPALARHDLIIEEVVGRSGGTIEEQSGDGAFAVFHAGNPLACALEIQLALQEEEWSAIGGLLIRIGVHSGTVIGESGYDQVAANRAARIMSSAWGGQIVVSDAASKSYGAPPKSELTDLGIFRFKGIDEPLRIFGLVHPGLARTTFPPLRSLSSHSQSLPDSTAPFFGREQEVNAVTAKIGQARTKLISIVGPGGIGKSRLALQVVADSLKRKTVYYVGLESVSNSAALITAVANVLRFPLYGSASPENQLTDYLRDRDLVLVLDNIDKLIGDTRLVASLLCDCPSLTLLATAREPLGIPGEGLYRLSGFPPPGPSDEDLRASPAYQMFLQEARSANRPFDHSHEELEIFREIFRVLNGSPLALHLTAQWTYLLSPRAILEKLRTGLDFLSERRASVPERHRSLSAVFEGSWALLTKVQMEALARLSVFPAEFDVNAAEHVGRVGMDTVAELESKALIEHDGKRRLIMHAIVQEHARRKLAEDVSEEESARSRHSSYYLDLLCNNSKLPYPMEQSVMLDQLEQEMANLREAWTYSVRNRQYRSLSHATEPLFYFLALRALYREGTAFFDIHTDCENFNQLLKGVLANCLVHQGEFARAEAAGLRALEGRSEALIARAHASQALGNLAHARGDLHVARERYEYALATRTELGDLMGDFFSTTSLAALHILVGDTVAAREYVMRSFRISRETRNTHGLMLAHLAAGDIAIRENRPSAAESNFAISLRLEESVHNPQLRATILLRLGSALASLGDLAGAEARHQEAFDLATEVGDQRVKALALLAIGRDKILDRKEDQARGSILAAIRLGKQLNSRFLIQQGLLDLARLELGLGNGQRAKRLVRGVDPADLGVRRGDYDVILAQLAHVSEREWLEDDSEAALGELFREQELQALLL
jgi:predicted ATPase/class 3 adenylate cyclase